MRAEGGCVGGGGWWTVGEWVVEMGVSGGARKVEKGRFEEGIELWRVFT